MATFGQLTLLVGLALSPFAAAQDEAILNAEIGRLNNDSLLWGPYRPNLYFGVRPRLPESLSASLLWSNLDVYGGPRDSQ